LQDGNEIEATVHLYDKGVYQPVLVDNPASVFFRNGDIAARWHLDHPSDNEGESGPSEHFRTWILTVTRPLVTVSRRRHGVSTVAVR